MFLQRKITKYTADFSVEISRLKNEIETADAIVIGAGAGLSTAAGFTYSGERFEKYFSDFIEKYNFRDMYSGGFYPFESLEEHWAYWSRYVYINRYMDVDNGVYKGLFELVKDKDYFVLTTNFRKPNLTSTGFSTRRVITDCFNVQSLAVRRSMTMRILSAKCTLSRKICLFQQN